MKILLAASEAVPYCKTGGLADVVGALADKLHRAGHEVRLVLPRYRGLPASAPRTRFIDKPEFFDRPGLYGENGADYPDNHLRFAYFCRAALATGFEPDVVHLHDWQTGPIAALLRSQPRRPAVVMTVHNLAYQGVFPMQAAREAGFDESLLNPDGMEFYGQASFLKAGLVFSDLITTVSPTYAREIQESSELGCGLEGLLRHRASQLHGVINGLDLEMWNPGTDPHLERRFGVKDAAAGKGACKRALLAACGLDPDPQAPLIAIVSRFDRQKGLDLALAALEPRLNRCRLAVLGSGDPGLTSAFQGLAARHPGRVHLHAGFDEAFAHRLYASSDFFLMPSRFEPCGLGQMIAMRYGSVPVASRTGGLADTVFEDGPRPNGFVCRPDDAEDLGRALDRALAAYPVPGWAARSRAGMESDFSWDRSVARYLELYGAARGKEAAR
jgi:starch synthase